jgi:hypothetical protein
MALLVAAHVAIDDPAIANSEIDDGINTFPDADADVDDGVVNELAAAVA